MNRGLKVRVDRILKTLTKTLYEVGGINSIAFVLFINFVYSRWAMRDIVVNEIFKFLHDKKPRSARTGSGKEPQSGS